MEHLPGWPHCNRLALPRVLLRRPSTGRGHFPKHPSERPVAWSFHCRFVFVFPSSRRPSSSNLFSLTPTVSRLQLPHVFDDGTPSTQIASTRTNQQPLIMSDEQPKEQTTANANGTNDNNGVEQQQQQQQPTQEEQVKEDDR